MRVVIITDTHSGVRNDHIAFLDNYKLFLDNVFFPYINDNRIDTIVHLGDIVDRRKYINFFTAKRLREDFLEPCESKGLNLIITAGNHDVYFKNTNAVNSLRELLRGYNNIEIIDIYAKEILLGDLPVLMIPWICDDNREQITNMIKETSAHIAMGHLELAGFEMYKGSMPSHGMEREEFNKFDMVFSGHYHHQSTDGHIFYLGSHGEFTWSDYNDHRGFHIFDTETRTLTFIRNPYIMFKKIFYNDINYDYSVNTDLSEYKNCIIKMIIQNKNNHYMFEKYVERLEEVGPLEIQIIDEIEVMLTDDEDSDVEDTMDVFKKHISTLDSNSVDKKWLEKHMNDLYHEALHLE